MQFPLKSMPVSVANGDPYKPSGWTITLVSRHHDAMQNLIIRRSSSQELARQLLLWDVCYGSVKRCKDFRDSSEGRFLLNNMTCVNIDARVIFISQIIINV